MKSLNIDRNNVYNPCKILRKYTKIKMMKEIITLVFLVLMLPIQAQKYNYPETAHEKVSDNYFGTVISDPYRWLEDLNNPKVLDWFHAQADFSRLHLDRIPGRAELLNQIIELTNMEGDITGKPYRSGDFYYFKRILKGESFANLYRRDIQTHEEELFFDVQKYKKGAQINSFAVNHQATTMALKIQDEGSELCEIIFLELPGKTVLKNRLYPIWSEMWMSFNLTGDELFYTQMATSDLNSNELLKNMKVKKHKIGEDPLKDVSLMSSESYPRIEFPAEKLPLFSFSSDKRYAFLILAAATNYISAYYTEVGNLKNQNINWKPIITEEDQISAFFTFEDQLFFHSFKDAPHFKIGVTDIKNPNFINSKIIVPNGNETITSLKASKNYLFFEISNGITQNLYRIDPQNHVIDKVETPGGINIGFAMNPMESDELAIINSNWLSPNYFLEFDLDKQGNAVKSQWLNSETNFPDFEVLYEIKEIEIPGHDGVMIPLSVIYPKNIKFDGSTPCYLTGYGGYGYSFYPFFLREEIAFLQQGGIIAIAHVRGGGEKGEEWHQAGMRKNKPNTWKDFISAAEYLIKEHYTSPQKLIGEGTSAGGILIGRAITERPDLFAAAINNVGLTQALRNETTANGENHIPEMGSVKNEDDISALIEMDAQSKIKNEIKYPAILNLTGINDSRVVPWMPAKFAAAMQASSVSEKPVLLWVNFKGSHGANDMEDYQNQLADILSFSLWQTGHPDFQPED